VRKKNWAEDRVFYFGDDGQLTSLPAGWTDVDPPDPFVEVAAGRSAFRVEDLVALATLIDGLRPAKRTGRVKRTTLVYVRLITPQTASHGGPHSQMP
jgi:hypothetical protein